MNFDRMTVSPNAGASIFGGSAPTRSSTTRQSSTMTVDASPCLRDQAAQRGGPSSAAIAPQPQPPAGRTSAADADHGRLTAVALLRHRGQQEPVLLGLAADLSRYGYFQRGTARQVLQFVCRTLAKKTPDGTRHAVNENEGTAYAQNHDGLVAVAIADVRYPQSAGFGTLKIALDRFSAHSEGHWRAATTDSTDAEPVAKGVLELCADPAQADRLLHIQRDLNEIKATTLKSIDALLDRGEKLDTLMQRSQDLRLASKVFAKQARKANSCCRLM